MIQTLKTRMLIYLFTPIKFLKMRSPLVKCKSSHQHLRKEASLTNKNTSLQTLTQCFLSEDELQSI